MTTEILNPKLEITHFNEAQKSVLELKRLNDGLVFDYNTPAGSKNARSHIYKMRQTKAGIESVRKEAKAYALEYGRKVDAVAKSLTAEIEAMIAVHQKPIDEIERRERDRVARIRADIDEMRTCPDHVDGKSAECLRDRLNEIRGTPITEDAFMEFTDEARQVHASAIARMEIQCAAAEKREAEAAELERLRAAMAERDQREREERIAREAAERARQEAEAKARAEQEAAIRREREAIESERRAIAEAKESRERAERDRVEAQRRHEEEVKAAEERARQKAIADREAAEQKRQAELRTKKMREKTIKDICDCLCDLHGLEEALSVHDATLISEAIMDGKIEHVACT